MPTVAQRNVVIAVSRTSLERHKREGFYDDRITDAVTPRWLPHAYRRCGTRLGPVEVIFCDVVYVADGNPQGVLSSPRAVGAWALQGLPRRYGRISSSSRAEAVSAAGPIITHLSLSPTSNLQPPTFNLQPPTIASPGHMWDPSIQQGTCTFQGRSCSSPDRIPPQDRESVPSAGVSQPASAGRGISGTWLGERQTHICESERGTDLWKERDQFLRINTVVCIGGHP